MGGQVLTAISPHIMKYIQYGCYMRACAGCCVRIICRKLPGAKTNKFWCIYIALLRSCRYHVIATLNGRTRIDLNIASHYKIYYGRYTQERIGCHVRISCRNLPIAKTDKFWCTYIALFRSLDTVYVVKNGRRISTAISTSYIWGNIFDVNVIICKYAQDAMYVTLSLSLWT